MGFLVDNFFYTFLFQSQHYHIKEILMYLHFILITGQVHMNLIGSVILLYNRIELVSENIERTKYIIILQLVFDNSYSFILVVQLYFFYICILISFFGNFDRFLIEGL